MVTQATQSNADQVAADSDYQLRFGGTRRLYGELLTEYYRQAQVVVVGIGGVGSWVAEALARTAIGQITLIDLDDICISNINRQVHATSSSIGQMKVDVMAARLRDINPYCQVNTQAAFIQAANIAELIPDDVDYVVDAIDNVRDKAALIAWCKRRKIPLITIGGAGGQTDPTQVSVADLTRTSQDPLAAKLRSVLKRHHGFSKTDKFGIDCVYSTEQLRYPQADGSVCHRKPDAGGPTRLDCAGGFGAATCVTATFGFVAVARLLKKMEARFVRQQAAG
ncbi:tRNA cyclic N6-threonylcarbamoyladenosine(37) synthase TcdA [Nitrincola iocasae]|uniref:tRNA threonylcarbamoyladenosine dehydratase n=1 Tax=Nitrincola iocasae TaxID=2614693 RepID=A0A5J6LFI3_9GAMM|nr:tRNA cyclic N6-threonylcarbamoyladenosine(37) synthase TcdA [Nitrincola iocasae]QEW07153.1 tRNA cyclic N6-threonylcarbamoyladenosine(37) synthase TcdA [Nitrincola iocasae]